MRGDIRSNQVVGSIPPFSNSCYFFKVLDDFLVCFLDSITVIIEEFVVEKIVIGNSYTRYITTCSDDNRTNILIQDAVSL